MTLNGKSCESAKRGMKPGGQMRIEDLHDEFCAALFSCGGVPPETLLNKGYKGPKADAVFPDDRALVEVKSLCSDRVEAAEVEGFVDDLFTDWTKHGGPVVFGQISYDVAKLPEPWRGRLLRFYGKRIRRELEYANRQIRETAKALDMPDAYGVVAFLTPATFRTHVGVISHAAWSLLQDPSKAPCINGLINFAVPVEDHGDPHRPEDMLAVPHSRGGRSFPNDLARRIAEAWGAHFSARSGTKLDWHDWSEEAFFDRFTSDP